MNSWQQNWLEKTRDISTELQRHDDWRQIRNQKTKDTTDNVVIRQWLRDRNVSLLFQDNSGAVEQLTSELIGKGTRHTAAEPRRKDDSRQSKTIVNKKCCMIHARYIVILVLRFISILVLIQFSSNHWKHTNPVGRRQRCNLSVRHH